MGGIGVYDSEAAVTEVAVPAFPTIVNVEVFRGSCPCCCVHCPVGATMPAEREGRFGRKAMDLRLFDKIVAEVAANPPATLRVHSVGEPLEWPELPAALELAHDRTVRTWVFTCAVTRERSLLDALCDHASIVEVSVDATNAADYRRSKGVDAFDLVVDNLRYMHARIEAGAPARLLATRVQSSDSTGDEEFVAAWMETGLVHDAFVRSYHSYNDILGGRPASPAKAASEPCLVHWARFNIDLEGEAVVCFNELFRERREPAVTYGSVLRQEIAEIWHGRRLRAVREAALTGDYGALPGGGELPCDGCRYCQPLFGDGVTSEHQLSQLPSARDGHRC